MAKTKKAVKATAKKTKKRKKVSSPKMVWQIFKFFERFEYTHDAFKKKPLVFVKSFVGSGSDDISAEYFKQMQDLWLYDDYHVLKTVFADIRDISANAGIKHRGYLLDGNHKPATNGLVGSWVKLDARAAGAALKRLAKVGLIERVELPDFDAMEEPQPPPKNPPDEGKKGEKPISGKKRKKTGKKSEPLKNGKNGKGKGKSKITASGKRQTENVNKKTAKALTGQGEVKKPQPGHHPADIAANGQGQLKGPILRTGQQGASDGEQGTADADSEHKPSTAPATAPTQPMPQVPTKADGPGSGQTEASAGSSASTKADEGLRSPHGPDGPGDRPPSHCDKPTFEGKYNPQARAFASEIFLAIKVPGPVHSANSYRELGCFAAQWNKAQAVVNILGDDGLAELWRWSVAKAENLGKKRHRRNFTKGPEAVWVTTFNSNLAKLVAKARANPPPKKVVAMG